MNIISNAQTGGNAPAAAANRQSTADSGEAAVRTQPDNTVRDMQNEPRQAANNGAANRPSAMQRDEYVPARKVSVSGAVYTVSDISKGTVAGLDPQMQVGRVTSSGQRISRKLLEIELPLGRKSLKIYGVK
ncbi:MAG: hypothetical protein J7M24_06885 [Candidatus Latescibacteria bacterium]|nr:hypothetical protein [Candidatus Latescibacterota bacterium]